jgi:allantoicase
MSETITTPAFTNLLNLASEKSGAQALSCSDDFFAEKENLLKSGRGIFIPDKYTDRGKWMDGWESRRKRIPGHDWCIIRLGASGTISGVDIDTNHFLGNHPPFASIDACRIENVADEKSLSTFNHWKEILPKSALNPGSQNFFDITDKNIYTHLRLNIYPDGGVARLKVYGTVYKDWSQVKKDEVVDLASAVNGAKAIRCNDMFFSHMDNLLMPGKGVNMGDGWETKRNRTPGNRDWVIVRLAHRGSIKKINVDTAFFKGNYPDGCSVEACSVSTEDEKNISNAGWKEILPRQKLEADREHLFEKQLINTNESFTHIRLFIDPDGGVSRLRVYGVIS